ncbi:TransThyretin-Related family domain [Aphelenchoides bicaudatus]|nr:TransThyretin-Related family domain [Aphelenchoides bicaudatus]
MNKLFLLVLGIALFVQVQSVGRTQSAGARGRLMCKGRPASGLQVKLFDHDTFTPDDKMSSTITQNDGSFNVVGRKSEVGAVRPDVKIYHKCGHIFTKCHKIRIPSDFVVWGDSPRSIYDVGTLNLENVKANC